MELHTAWGAVYPHKKTLNDTELVYVAIAYNQGQDDHGTRTAGSLDAG